MKSLKLLLLMMLTLLMQSLMTGCTTVRYKIITSEEKAIPLKVGETFTSPFSGWYISDKVMQGLLLGNVTDVSSSHTIPSSSK